MITLIFNFLSQEKKDSSKLKMFFPSAKLIIPQWYTLTDIIKRKIWKNDTSYINVNTKLNLFTPLLTLSLIYLNLFGAMQTHLSMSRILACNGNVIPVCTYWQNSTEATFTIPQANPWTINHFIFEGSWVHQSTHSFLFNVKQNAIPQEDTWLLLSERYFSSPLNFSAMLPHLDLFLYLKHCCS